MRLASDQREHRRGLVLGLTMAEVLLLLLFLLLLALATRLALQTKKLEVAQSTISTLEPLLTSLATGERLTPQQIQELARDLADAARLRSENARLQSTIKTLEPLLASLAAGKQLTPQQIQEQAQDLANAARVKSENAELQATIKALEPLLSSLSSGKQLPPQQVQELARDLADAARLRSENARLQSTTKTLEPILSALASGKQLTPQQVQDMARDLADGARLRSENGQLQSQLADLAKRSEELARLEARANEINPNDPPATTLRKGLERTTPQFESALAEWRRRAQTQEEIEREARRINPTAPPQTTIASALKQARPGPGDDEKLGGQVRERLAVLRDTEERLNRDLKRNLGGQLEALSAELDPKSLTLRFNRTDLMFEQGKATLRPGFEQILSQLFPEYLRTLYGFKDDIEEVRIEGHTSSEWGNQTGLQAYFPNMALSQERTRAVLEYGLTKTNLPPEIVEWGRRTITANGLSSSRPRAANTGAEDSDASRRVEFRVLMKAKEQLLQIVEPATR